MIASGQLLGGKYQIVRSIGEGGMSEVFEAINELIAKRVAVKVLRPESVGDTRSSQRFLSEARAAAAIGHPCIIDIYDLGRSEEGAPFIVMEYLEGRSLSDVIGDESTLDGPLTAYVACQVLCALDAVHAKGIVHRDLTTTNVFLAETGRKRPDVKLLDFGISKILGDGPNAKLTQTGTVLGTPLYMSPEQASGRVDLDQRVDLWAMGIILYECVTGTVPFGGHHYNDVLAKILTDSYTAPRVLAREVLPPSLEGAIASALQKERDARCPSAVDLLERLIPLVDGKDLDQLALPESLRSMSKRFARPEDDEHDDPTVQSEIPDESTSFPPTGEWTEAHSTEPSIPMMSATGPADRVGLTEAPTWRGDASQPSISGIEAGLLRAERALPQGSAHPRTRIELSPVDIPPAGV